MRLDVAGGESDREAVVTDGVGAEAVDDQDAGEGFNFGGDGFGDGWVTVHGGEAGGAEVEVGADLSVDPGEHRFAEAADHDSNARHHGDGGGEGGD